MGGSGSGGLGSTGSMSGGSRGTGAGGGAGGRQSGAGGGVAEPQFNEFGSVGNSIGQGGFVGRSDNSGRFVGQGQAGQQGNLGAGGLGLGGGRGRNGAGNLNSNNNGGGNNANQSQRRVRPQLKVAFPVTRVPTTIIASSLQQRMSTETLTAGTLRNVQLNMSDEGVVTLSGAVASEDARSLAAAMVRLEPGVRKVVNELTVQE